MEQLTKTQIVLLVLLVSFFTSLVTGIVTVTLVNQAPEPIVQNINRIVQKTVDAVVPDALTKNNEVKTVVITQEDLIINVVNNVSSAVVSVIATKDLPVIEQYFINPFKDSGLPEALIPNVQIPQYRQNGIAKTQVSSGTGFFVSKDGMLITNKHVVEDTGASYSIVTNNGDSFDVEVLARDPLQDFAILKIKNPKSEFNFIQLGSSDNLKIGQTVIAIGNTLGQFQNTVSAGIISGLNRTISAQGSFGKEELSEIIQTDAAINFGNSGGPLLDLNGRVIGINTAMAASAENVGFTLPINIIKRGIKDVQEFGEIRYPFLGIRYVLVNDAIKSQRTLSVNYGLLIERGVNSELAIMKDSPAEKAGLKEGDIILQFNGVKISKENSLNFFMNKLRVGDKVNLKVLRKDGGEADVEVTLEKNPN